METNGDPNICWKAATLRQKRTPPLFLNNGLYQPPLLSPLNP